MVIENFQPTPLLEWLLGPGWRDGALFSVWTLLILLVLVCLAVVWRGLYAARLATAAGRALAGRNRDAVVGIAFGGAIVAGALLAGLWAIDWGVGEVTTRAVLGGVFRPALRLVAWLLGPGWHQGAVSHWLLVTGCVVAAVFVIGWLVAAIRSGPRAATVRSGRVLVETVVDLARTSPRRVLALAWLAVRDSIRRRVVIVFAVFVLLMLFAGWFLSPSSDQPGRLYLQFVLTSTGYLVLMLAWILSALSIPSDIKDRTLQTLVTKPVRQTEIVLGRILGFAAVGTALFAPISVISYFFTVRGLDHTHPLTEANLREEAMPGNRPPLKKGLTSLVHGHQHEVTIDPSGGTEVEIKQGHWHDLTVGGAGEQVAYTLGRPQGLLVARVPVYGKLRFLNRQGQPEAKGINVGDEWTYRSFIVGGTQAAAIWTFEGIGPDLFPESMFPDAVPIEMTIEVFRSHKGELARGILGSLWLRNPETGLKVVVRNFPARKFATDVQWVPRTLMHHAPSGEAERLDLMRDLVSSDGRLEVWLQCLEQGMYFGVAQADLYFRARDASFLGNFVKGYLGIWLQMIVVSTLGVVFSTFLSGPVAMIATLGGLIGSLFSGYMAEVASGKMIGGGPFEAFIRIVTQQNVISEMEPGLQTNVAVMSDRITQGVLWVLSSLLPAFDRFDLVDYVAYGFDVNSGMMGQSIFRAAAFVIPAMVAGYFFLKMREVAQ